MQLVAPPVDIVDSLYRLDLPVPSWLEGIRASAESVFSGILGAQVFTFEIGDQGQFRLGEMASAPNMGRIVRQAHHLASPSFIRDLYLRRPIATLCETARRHPGDPGYALTRRYETQQVMFALGVDPGGAGIALALALDRPERLSLNLRRTLERIAGHLGAVRRLRSSPSACSPPPTDPDRADAVLSVDGRILHAAEEARSQEAQAALRHAVLVLDRVHRRSHGMSSDEALGLWQVLVDGSWSLLERFESDGRRLFVARRNSPTTRASRALTTNERRVVALISVGHSLKLCAYELGLKESTVSGLAQRAMCKLGVRSRAELIELHGAIVAAGDADGAAEGGGGEMPVRGTARKGKRDEVSRRTTISSHS